MSKNDDEISLGEQIAHLKMLCDGRSGRFTLDRAILRSLERLARMDDERRAVDFALRKDRLNSVEKARLRAEYQRLLSQLDQS